MVGGFRTGLWIKPPSGMSIRSPLRALTDCLPHECDQQRWLLVSLCTTSLFASILIGLRLLQGALHMTACVSASLLLSTPWDLKRDTSH